MYLLDLVTVDSKKRDLYVYLSLEQNLSKPASMYYLFRLWPFGLGLRMTLTLATCNSSFGKVDEGI